MNSLVLVALLSVFAEPTQEQRAGAVALLNEGNTLYNAGDYISALSRYHMAYNLMPNPKLLFNLAKTNRKLKKTAQAATYFDRFIRTSGYDPDSPFMKEATEAYADLRPRIGLLLFRQIPEGTTLTLNNKLSVDTATVAVRPGTHQIRAVAADGQVQEHSLSIRAGEQQVVPLQLDIQTEVPPEPIAVVKPPIEESSILEAWWFWAIVGAAIAGTVTTVVLVSKGEDQDPVFGEIPWNEWKQ